MIKNNTLLAFTSIPYIPVCTFPRPRPLAWLKNKYKTFMIDNDTKVKFSLRNDIKVVTPFLDGLKCDYLILQQLVLVKDLDTIAFSQLVDLGFLPTSSVLPQNKILLKAIAVTDVPYSTRVYHQGYDVEIHLIPAKYWCVASTAHQVARELKAPDENFLDYFLKAYSTLITIMQDKPSK